MAARIPKIARPIFLIGFSGSGKTSIGERLAWRLSVNYVDTDDLIEEKTGLPVPEFIESKGLDVFRKRESAVIKALCSDGPPAVVSLGGGAFESPDNRRLLLRSGVVVYLRCAEPELYRRLKDLNDRPLLHTIPNPGETRSGALKQRIHDLLAKRKPDYERAHITVSTTRGTLQDRVSAIVTALGRL
jgi:shikimate kinase